MNENITKPDFNMSYCNDAKHKDIDSDILL